MILASTSIVVGPSVFVALAIIAALVFYERSNRSKDEAKSKSAIDAIRRCGACDKVVDAAASMCRHCGSDLPEH